MNSDSQLPAAVPGKARWIAAGFIGAFVASVLTVIFTGLMVEGSPSEFDAGFHSVTLAEGEVAAIALEFDLRDPVTGARLELNLPPMLERVDTGGGGPAAAALSLDPGSNELSVAVRAVAVGSGYLVARILADEPVALERVFVTVTAGEESE